MNQFRDKKNVEIVVLANDKLKPNFENIGVNYRKLPNWGDNMLEPLKDAKTRIFEGFVVLEKLEYYAANNAKELAKIIDSEKPDLILYDVTCLFLRWTLEYYTKWYDISQKIEPVKRANLEFNPSKLPPMIAFNPSFAMDHVVYPNKIEEKFLIPPFFTVGFFLGLLFFLIAHFYRCYKCGLGLKNPFKNVFPAPLPNTKFMLVCVFPELQARSHLLDTNMYKLIGCTIDDTVKNEFSINDNQDLKEIFNTFKVRDSKKNILEEEKEHLIYISMGSTFNNNLEAYRKILDGIKSFNHGSNKHGIKLDNLRVVVSTGEYVLNKLTEEINKNEYLLPKNILLIKSVPQFEVLKRATLFITHSGQNSVSEAVHFGGFN